MGQRLHRYADRRLIRERNGSIELNLAADDNSGKRLTHHGIPSHSVGFALGLSF
jgi:hypothetical protein